MISPRGPVCFKGPDGAGQQGMELGQMVRLFGAVCERPVPGIAQGASGEPDAIFDCGCGFCDVFGAF